MFPPLGVEMQFRLVVDEYLYLLPVLVECVACGGIYGCRVLLEWYVDATLLLHRNSASHELLDIDAGTCNRKESDRCEHRESSAYVVRDDERAVSLFVGTCACRTFLRVGDSNDEASCRLFAYLCLELCLE